MARRQLDDPFDRTFEDDEEEKVKCKNKKCGRRFYPSTFGAANVDDNWFCSENCYEEWDEDGRVQE